MTEINTGDEAIDILVKELHENIEAKDKEKTKLTLERLYTAALTNPMLAKWITTPVNLTALQNKLVEGLEINPRLLQLKGRVANRQRRGVLFFKAMINGVSKT